MPSKIKTKTVNKPKEAIVVGETEKQEEIPVVEPKKFYNRIEILSEEDEIVNGNELKKVNLINGTSEYCSTDEYINRLG